MDIDIEPVAEDILFVVDSLTKTFGEFVKLEDIQKNLHQNKDLSETELSFIVNYDLVARCDFLKKGNRNTSKKYQITPKGYSHLHHLRTQGGEIAFCAMWFDDSVTPAWTEAIEPAIKECGYKAVRIDEVHHNNDINAEIIKNINKAKFIIADFTGNRGGVYFEAGYASGIRIPVIYTCEKDSWK